MNKKISLGVALALVLTSIAVTFAVTMATSQNIYNKLISNISGRAEMYSAIDNINALIRNNYYFFSSINNENVNYSVSNGYIKGLGDENSKYLTAKEYAEYKNRLNGNANGVGITTAWDSENNVLRITSVAAGSSAATNGIKVNDILVKVSGETITEENADQLISGLNGDTLSSVTLTCKRNDTLLEFSVTVGYSFISVTSKNIGSVGYIRISAFYANTQDQLKEAISQLQSLGISSLVFDLRGTKDGTVEYAAAAIDCITPICSNQNEVLVSLIGRDGKTMYSYPSSSNNLSLPMVVLINKDTAGPAELFACDLRDFDKASLVGVTTAGVGTAQQTFILQDGSAAILTTSKIVPYKSDSFHEVGIKPDYDVKLGFDSGASPELLSTEKDAQLQKAIQVLSSQ